MREAGAGVRVRDLVVDEVAGLRVDAAGEQPAGLVVALRTPFVVVESGHSPVAIGSLSVKSFSAAFAAVEARVFMYAPANSPQAMSPIVSVMLIAASPNAPFSTPSIVCPFGGMLTSPAATVLARLQAVSFGVNAVPVHVWAQTSMFAPPWSVSKVIRTSPVVRLGSCGHSVLAGSID